MSIDPKRFALNEYVNSNWTLTVEENTSLADVMKPEFLANVAVQLHPYDHIRVRVDSGEWYAELLVVSCGRVWAKTTLLLEKKLVEEDATEDPDVSALNAYFIKANGPHLKFCVIRKADKEIIKDSFETKHDAQTWLNSHLLTM